ncbi:hypothetical protein FRC12_009003 [Ceratobasidium sp. 428]|nr:hypothetical protein FRC12_009003 [Ceratobasidium sp. 428]
MTSPQTWKSKFPAVHFEIRDPSDPNGVPNSYIVMLKAHCDKKAHVEWLRSIASSMKPEDIKIGYVYGHALNGYSVELTDDGMSAVAASPDVRSIHQSTTVGID